MIEAGYELVILDNLVNSCTKSMERVTEITGKKLTFEQVDLLEYKEVLRVFKTYKFTGVIHFAALKAVGESVEKPIMYYNNNMTGLFNLLMAMDASGVNNIIYSSSATVYGSNPFSTEGDKIQPFNPYGQTKAMAEQVMQDVCVANKEFTAISLRYFNPIGAHSSGKIGDSPNGIPNNLLPYVQKVAVGKLPELSVFGDDYDTPDGTGIRDYIHVVDLAKGHIAALKKTEELKGFHPYNLGTGNGTSVLEIISAFEKASQAKVPYKIVGRREGDVGKVTANADKANQELGWKASLTIEDMCKDAWTWISKNPNGYEDDEDNAAC